MGLKFKAPKTFTLNFDPRTSLAKIEVVKILHLQKIANQISNGFNDAPRIIQTSLNEAKIFLL